MKTKIVGILTCMLFFASAISSAMNVGMNPDDEIDQQQIEDSGYGQYFYGSYWCVQSFVPYLEILTRVQLQWFRAGNPPDDLNIVVRIRDSLSGEDLATASVKGSQIQDYYVWIEFDFSDMSVNIGEVYYIVCSVDECFECDSSNYYAWYFEINNPYKMGEAWTSSDYGNAGSWSILSTPELPDRDFCFITYGRGNSAPNTPTITGPTSGKVGEGYGYTFVTTDPDGHDIYYYIEWGDDTNETIGLYNSGEEITVNHAWDEEGTYTIKAKAKDIYDAESSWATLTVSMPKDKAINPFILFLERLIERFPILEQILQPIYDKLA